MANTYSQITIQAVFAVKHRERLIGSGWRDRLHKYMCGILKSSATPLAVGGWNDHVHVLFGMQPSITISDIVQKVKANSSKWINENGFVHGNFEWQVGYGAFSYSRDQRDRLIRYIMNQEQHHGKKTFHEEYFQLLKEFEVAFDDHYLFEFFE